MIETSQHSNSSMNMSPRLARWVPILALVCGGLVAGGCRKQVPAAAAVPSVPVIATEVVVRDQPVYLELIGQTRGSREVEIRARVEGFLDAIHFAEGFPVSSNALLYTLDDRPFQAVLGQAEAGLAQARAAVEKARRDTNRLGPLWLRNAISRQQLDDALSSERAAAAAAEAAEAGVRAARIQLGYTEIRSPIDGLAGKSEVGVGNLVGRGSSTLLTTVSATDPISVRFSVSEQQYLAWRRKVGGTVQDREGGKGLFELILADGQLHPHRGDVAFADGQVDPRTGTLMLEVRYPNPERIVRPGQFARVRFSMDVVTNAVLVPQRSVVELQATYSVFVAGADGAAEFRRVVPGDRVGSWMVIREGLKAGEKVVVEGVQKLQNRVPIAVTLTNLAPGAGTAEAR